MYLKAGVLLVALAPLAGCGVAPQRSVPVQAAHVQACGAEGRSCWKVQDTVEVVSTDEPNRQGE